MGKLISIPSDSPDNNSDSDSDLNVLTDEPENCVCNDQVVMVWRLINLT